MKFPKKDPNVLEPKDAAFFLWDVEDDPEIEFPDFPEEIVKSLFHEEEEESKVKVKRKRKA